MRILILTLCVFLLDCSYAGYKVGNGGHVIECGNKVQFFDTYFTRKFWSADYSKFDEFTNYEVIVYKQLSILKSFFPEKVNEIQKVHSKRDNYFIFSKDLKPANTDDSASPYQIPNGCSLRQLAIQYFDHQLNKTVVVVDKNLFMRLTELEKAAFVFHEYVYTVFRYPNAENVRSLVHIFLTVERFKYNDLFSRRESLINLGLEMINYKGIGLDLKSNFEFFEGGMLRSAGLASNRTFKLLDLSVVADDKSYLELYPGGSIKKISYKYLSDEKNYFVLNGFHYPMPNIYGQVSFFTNENIKSVKGLRGITKDNLMDLNTECVNKKQIYFNFDQYFDYCL